MCDFISWVEKETEGEIEIFVLTEEDVFSPYGRKVLEGYEGNKLLGHEVIRIFYNLGEKGQNRKTRSFWKTEGLPRKLAKMVKSFDTHWGEMFRSGIFQNSHLCYIVCCATGRWRQRAWDQLMKQNPSNKHLLHIFFYASAKWVKKARAILKERGEAIVQHQNPRSQK